MGYSTEKVSTLLLNQSSKSSKQQTNSITLLQPSLWSTTTPHYKSLSQTIYTRHQNYKLSKLQNLILTPQPKPLIYRYKTNPTWTQFESRRSWGNPHAFSNSYITIISSFVTILSAQWEKKCSLFLIGMLQTN